MGIFNKLFLRGRLVRAELAKRLATPLEGEGEQAQGKNCVSQIQQRHERRLARYHQRLIRAMTALSPFR